MKRVRRGAAVAGNLPSAREREKYDENEIRNKKCFGNPREGRWGWGGGAAGKGMKSKKKNEKKSSFLSVLPRKKNL